MEGAKGMTRLQGRSLFLARSFLVLVCLGAPACASSRAVEKPDARSIPGLPDGPVEAIREIEEEILRADAEIETAEPRVSAESETKVAAAPKPAHRSRIPLEINENVMKWIHYFTVTDRERFHRFLKRGSVYKELVQDILRKNNVPTDLYYLAMIESGYVTHAKSHASAVGIWQFIPGTGKRYGLQQNAYVDERRDVVRATDAAAKYLRNLHNAFQSWYLAMAGYNAGEGRILGALMRGGSRDFWDLVERKALPPETRNYVPKFLAATLIGKNPAKYGFKDIDAPSFPKVKPLSVPPGAELATVSRQSGIPLRTLRTLNPHLRRTTTPRTGRPYALWIPQNSSVDADAVQKELASLSASVTSKQSSARQATAARNFAKPRAKVARRTHVIRRGETLWGIAQRYNLSLDSLKRMNGLRSNQALAGKRLKVAGFRIPTTIVHKVRSGEGLTTIASRYRVSMSKIKEMNALRSNRIYVGQRLVIAKGI